MERVAISIEGRGPLLMHNGQLANPRNELVRQLKALTSINAKKKTDATRDAESRIEWLAGLYTDVPVEVEITRDYVVTVKDGPRVGFTQGVVLGFIDQAASKKRKKTAAQYSVACDPDAFFPLTHTGPKKLSALMAAEPFSDYRRVVMPSSGSAVMRTRPRFNMWALTFEVELLSPDVTFEDLSEIVEYAGRTVGIGDGRPRFGRFAVTKIERVTT